MKRKPQPDARPWAVIKADVVDGPVERCWYIETAIELEAIKEKDEPGAWMIIDTRTGRPYRKRQRRQRA